MNSFLRNASTRRLLATVAGALAVIGAGTAIALAASGSGPVPKRTSLANAIHQGLSAGPVKGITARIQFTNHLIDASDLQGSDPILTGASGRLWLSSDHRMRLELQSNSGQDAQALIDNRSFWVYDPNSNTVYEGTLPASATKHASKQGEGVPSVATIQRDINKLASHLNLSGAIPGDVAGQPAYTVHVSPKHDGGLLGAGELAWDALRGVPLRIAVYARGQSAPVLELKATDISYGSVPASDFAVSPPSGAKVVKIAPGAAEARSAKHRHHAQVSGVTAVAKRVPFKLVAPRALDGLKRQSVTLLDWAGSPAALITYGHKLGGVAVVEQVAKPGANRIAPNSSDHGRFSLPTVSIHGATGQELDTALGTMIRFTRGNVAYTVAGSVPPAAAELAARAL